MARDPVVEEIRKHRDAYASRFRYDLRAICADLKEQQEKGERRIVSLPHKPAKPVGAAKQ